MNRIFDDSWMSAAIRVKVELAKVRTETSSNLVSLSHRKLTCRSRESEVEETLLPSTHHSLQFHGRPKASQLVARLRNFNLINMRPFPCSYLIISCPLFSSCESYQIRTSNDTWRISWISGQAPFSTNFRYINRRLYHRCTHQHWDELLSLNVRSSLYYIQHVTYKISETSI